MKRITLTGLSPYVGLRPFEEDDALLFFGRDGHVDELVAKLADTRFVAVVGTSGSGKSSLVRAGLIPALHRGALPRTARRWNVYIVRPGDAPLLNLARELAGDERWLGGMDRATGEQYLRSLMVSSPLALAHLFASLPEQFEHEACVIVVDQFEEIFRYQQRNIDEAEAFVKLLLRTAASPERRLHVLITMRADFLGNCMAFHGLPEAINSGLYLTPRLNRDQLLSVIVSPLALVGGSIDRPLANHLVNNLAREDELPVLQHKLLRMWDHARTQNRTHLEFADFETVSRRAISTGEQQPNAAEPVATNAIDIHASEVYDRLPSDQHRNVARQLFVLLVDSREGRDVRHPRALAELVEFVGEDHRPELIEVVEAYRKHGVGFLVPPASVPLTQESMLDISHESLIRQWESLQSWLKEEAAHASELDEWKQRAQRHRSGEGDLLNVADSARAEVWLGRLADRQRGASWARRYLSSTDDPSFEQIQSFIHVSRNFIDYYTAPAVETTDRGTKRQFWRSDWVLGIVVALVVLTPWRSDLMQSLERKAYDMGVRASNRQPSADIAVIAIDDLSIAQLGWPWSRNVDARLIAALAAAQPKVIGYADFFRGPQIDPTQSYIEGELHGQLGPNGKQMLDALVAQLDASLNPDRTLARQIGAAGNVVLPVLFRIGEPLGRPDRDLPDYMHRNTLPLAADGPLPVPALNLEIPVLDEIGRNAAALGHLNFPPDADGVIRTEPLVLAYFGEFYPSLSLQIAARFRNLGPADVQARLGESLSLGRTTIRTDPSLQMYTYFYKDQNGRPAFAQDSFFDVYSGKIPAEKYRGKIVLIGTTATGVGSVFVTPVSPAMPAVMMQAHAVSSILQQHFLVAPVWGMRVSLAVFLLVALYLILVLPRLKAGTGAAATAVLLLLLLAAHFGLMVTQLMWIELMSAVVLLVVGHLTLTTKRFLVTERGKARSDFESAESNRMLGLAFQGQGQLDMAFDKFKKCPLDDQLLDTLYNLGLDFERKRQFNKAQAVFEYMATQNRKYKDLENRITRAKAMSETGTLGGGDAGP